MNTLPWMGIGQRWDGPQSACRQRWLGKGLDYFEPNLPTDLAPLQGHPVITHSSELGTATSGAMNAAMIDAVAAQVRRASPPWTGEHFSLVSAIDTGDLGYNIAPILDADTIEHTARNAAALQELYGVPLLLEAGPRYLEMGGWDDHAAMLAAARRANCGLIVDLSHHIVSMHNLGRAHTDGLHEAVLSRTVEVHVTGIGRHRGGRYWHDAHNGPIPDEVWTLLSWLLPRARNLRAITLEHDSTVPDDAYASDLDRLASLARGCAP